MAATHEQRFPGETPQYRQARDRLLQAEIDLHKQVQAVAELRRKLPLGGEVRDYVFEEVAAPLDAPATVQTAGTAQTATTVRLSELFAPRQSTLLLYSYMFGPKMQQPCPMCTSFLDGLNGNARHIRQRASFAVVARSPIERIREFARGRGWHDLRLLSSANNTYNRDYHGEAPDEDQIPMMTVFTRRNGKVHHFYSSEQVFVPEQGHDPCHLDLMWPLWNVLDLTPEGRGEDWYPKLKYDS
jgi:predicted dithiol-disulfide oxidoreductase (DUF899 family)